MSPASQIRCEYQSYKGPRPIGTTHAIARLEKAPMVSGPLTPCKPCFHLPYQLLSSSRSRPDVAARLGTNNKPSARTTLLRSAINVQTAAEASLVARYTPNTRLSLPTWQKVESPCSQAGGLCGPAGQSKLDQQVVKHSQRLVNKRPAAPAASRAISRSGNAAPWLILIAYITLCHSLM